LAEAVPPARTTGLTALLSVVVAFTPLAAQAQGASIEYAVKAAYLYKFAPFVEWPPTAFASASSPFQLCVLGRDPFGTSLDQAVNGQRVDEHRVVVRRLDRVDAASGCHVLYLGASSSQTAAEALRAVRGLPILTVADSGRDGGAIIKFVVKDNRVRFDIDTAAAAANHVTISSKLLAMAVSVRAGVS
jgi:hypothetical protein